MTRKDYDEITSAFPSENDYGMYLRDYFAAKAMAVFVADYLNPESSPVPENWYYHAAKQAYTMAEAMMDVRSLSQFQMAGYNPSGPFPGNEELP